MRILESKKKQDDERLRLFDLNREAERRKENQLIERYSQLSKISSSSLTESWVLDQNQRQNRSSLPPEVRTARTNQPTPVSENNQLLSDTMPTRRVISLPRCLSMLIHDHAKSPLVDPY